MANADGPNPRLLSELLLNSPEAKIAISIASEAPIEVPSPRGGGAAAALEQSPRGHRVGRWLWGHCVGQRDAEGVSGARTRLFGTLKPDPQPRHRLRISNSRQCLSLTRDLGGRAATCAQDGAPSPGSLQGFALSPLNVPGGGRAQPLLWA